MRLRLPCLATLLGLTILAPPARAQETPPAPVPPDPVGMWLGTLKVPPQTELRLLIRIERGDDGALRGTLDSLDQGANGLPIDQVTLEERTLRLGLTRLRARFEGTFASDGDRIEGHWHQNGRLPLELARTTEAPKTHRPQTPKPPFPYREREVQIPVQDFTLAGTLTVPDGEGPHPTVVLITGSGSQDRNESLMGHQPFLVLADHLARHGFAGLRCDDRGVGGSGGSASEATSADLAGDVVAMVAFLRQQQEVDGKRLGLCGHSEGGLIAPLVASMKDSGIAFCVLLAGPGVEGIELLLRQRELLLGQQMGKTELAKNQALHRELFTILAQEKDATTRAKAIEELAERAWDGMTAVERLRVGGPKDLLTALREADKPWLRWFLAHDPAPAVQGLRCPVLALNGEKDRQVDAAQNLGGLRAALQAGQNPDFACVALPDLNHLLQTCRTGMVEEYARIEETMAPAALAAITDWLGPRFGPKPR